MSNQEPSKLSTILGIINKKIRGVKNAFNLLFVEDKSANLFNKKGDIISGKAINVSTGEIVTRNAESIQYIPFEGAGYYSCLYPHDYYGTAVIKLCLFDSTKAFLRSVTGTGESTEGVPAPCTFSISEDDSANVAYIGYCFKADTIDTAMFVKSQTYPAEYIPFYDNGEKIASDKLQIVRVTEKSDNLFNKNGLTSAKKALNLSNGEETTRNDCSVQYIPFEGMGNYSCLYPQQYYGQTNIKICLYDSNRTFLRSVSGTKTVSENAPHPCNFTISESDAVNVAFIGYCYKTDTADVAMFVKASSYPQSYIPYFPSRTVLSEKVEVQKQSAPFATVNPLNGKIAVFDGDSICAGSTTGGWAKFIGNNNGMDWHNVGVSGGTITAGTTIDGNNRHWICRNIDTIHSAYSELDYLILEGGTNDADLLTDEEIGTIDQANFTTFDDTEFVGALESLFFKATSYYPSAKIGYIIPQRMGTWASYGYEADDSPSNRRRRKFFEIAIQVCQKWGIPFIDLWTGSPLCPKLEAYYDANMTPEENEEAGKAYKDGQHLTQVGYDIISPKIEAWMRTL